MATLNAFTWGYWGWGSESKYFLKAADWMEKGRGFLPPVFVDLRLARSGRAANFKGGSFEDIVGSKRYRWMPKLGNMRIKSKTGAPIQVADPKAAENLLDLIVAKAQEHRRIIMFCACEESLLDNGDSYPSCHRVEVASLLLAAAKKRGLNLEMSEWPGETPTSIRVEADAAQEKALLDDARFIPIGSKGSRLPAMATLGWGSTVQFDTPAVSWSVVTGPAVVRGDQWRLKVVVDGQFVGKTAAAKARRLGELLRKEGYGPRSTVG